MEPLFLKEKILDSSLSPYDNHCIGYPHQNGYITAPVLSIGTAKETFSHIGSKVLDSIIAYDRAEVNGTFIGQINMIIVSSFIGPHGLIWGYDLARNDEIELPQYLSPKSLGKDFDGIIIKNGENLRKASLALFGTRDEKHFPLLPGSHVPCAGRFQFASGPTALYTTLAIGIPEDRSKYACLLMEDVGQILSMEGISTSARQKISLNSLHSVLEVSKNQNIKFKEIFIDLVAEEIKAGDIGCALVAMPYFHLAKNAYAENLPNLSLKEWISLKEKCFKT
ncbi:histidine decarboxylase, pyruvoyl type [Candidatus Parcubacteria bacterium]|nr:histidine decarboxylase, pyruvoyl type [Patescibacteria group bacterium]MBU4466793.1 histidine decarboxylase, pyruvoyl type [Patescibacteria group bacterium]MCG2688371.1 histidine decarboxylase, pyruvoyl type [Candidatus Parcubacteria bacterium]